MLSAVGAQEPLKEKIGRLHGNSDAGWGQARARGSALRSMMLRQSSKIDGVRRTPRSCRRLLKGARERAVAVEPEGDQTRWLPWTSRLRVAAASSAARVEGLAAVPLEALTLTSKLVRQLRCRLFDPGND